MGVTGDLSTNMSIGASIDIGVLPKERVANCPREYQQLNLAFDRSIMPHVDPELMRKLQSTVILQPDEGK
jgi:hypothetical protein